MLVVVEVVDVEVVVVEVGRPGTVVVVVLERGRVVPGTVVDGCTVGVVVEVLVVVDGTVVVLEGLVVLVVFGAFVVGVDGAGRYFEHFPSALHRVMPLELRDFELELGSMLP